MYVCVYVCMHVYMYVCMLICHHLHNIELANTEYKLTEKVVVSELVSPQKLTNVGREQLLRRSILPLQFPLRSLPRVFNVLSVHAFILWTDKITLVHNDVMRVHCNTLITLIKPVIGSPRVTDYS